MKKRSYQTRGRRELMEFLSQNPDRQFTTDELCRAVRGEGEAAKSSVYRLLSKLCEEGAVRKFRHGEEKRSVYQFVGTSCDCGSHFHQKCTLCGRICHLDCHGSEEFASHLLKEHGFAVDCGQSILYGVCADCQKGGRSHA